MSIKLVSYEDEEFAFEYKVEREVFIGVPFYKERDEGFVRSWRVLKHKNPFVGFAIYFDKNITCGFDWLSNTLKHLEQLAEEFNIDKVTTIIYGDDEINAGLGVFIPLLSFVTILREKQDISQLLFSTSEALRKAASVVLGGSNE